MAGFNLFQKFYYGKAGQADYTPDQLPASRVQLFFEMLRIHFSGIILVNLLYLLFCVPALVWTVVNAQVLMSALELSDMAQMQGTLFVYLLGMIPCLGLSGVGATGEMFVLRNWARDEHVFLLSDFKDAVKGNWKYGLLAGLMGGASLFIGAVCFFFYQQMAQNAPVWIVPQMLVITVVVVWWMMNMLIFPMMVTYDLKFKNLLRNAAIMAIARLPFSALFLAGPTLVPLAIAMFIPNDYGLIAMIIFYIVIGYALTGFIYASYAISSFDKYLNPKIEGAPVNKGLREKGPDDETDDVEDPNPLV